MQVDDAFAGGLLTAMNLPLHPLKSIVCVADIASAESGEIQLRGEQVAQELGLLEAPVQSNLGYYGPMNLPQEVLQRFSRAALAATKAPEVVEKLRKLGLHPYFQSPADQLKDYEARVRMVSRAAKLSNYQPQ